MTSTTKNILKDAAAAMAIGCALGIFLAIALSQ